MALQKNTEQQNTQTRAEIERSAVLFERRDPSVSWLAPLLATHGLDARAGILARYVSVYEQDGHFVTGTWLTSARRFWEFTATIDHQSYALIELESFEDRSDSVTVSRHLPGIRYSWGQLALAVLEDCQSIRAGSK